jgi:DNA-binding NtrC family response regulator
VHILLAEDEESLRITLAANLELEGHSVLEACDGRQAIELLHHHQVDLVLSDIRMPNLGGIGLLQFVKKHRPELPVLLMTAYTLEEQVQTAISEGVFTVLRKPFDLAAVTAALVRAAKGPLVLVVDDDRADATMLAERLRGVGVRAEPAFEEQQAVAAIRNGFVDVCVLDMSISGVDGAAMVATFRNLDPELAIIVLSRYDASEMISRVSALGVCACMRKPVDPRELLGAVAKVRGGILSS